MISLYNIIIAIAWFTRMIKAFWYIEIFLVRLSKLKMLLMLTIIAGKIFQIHFSLTYSVDLLSLIIWDLKILQDDHYGYHCTLPLIKNAYVNGWICTDLEIFQGYNKQLSKQGGGSCLLTKEESFITAYVGIASSRRH